MQENRFHPGISIHKIQVGGDVGGLLFVIAAIAAVLMGIPSSWSFFVLAIGGGLVMAGLLHWKHIRHERRIIKIRELVTMVRNK